MSGSGKAILDVLTNSIGAVLILVILFIKLIGHENTPRPSLGASSSGTAYCSRVVVLAEARTTSREVNFSLEWTDASTGARWQWHSQPEPAKRSAGALQALSSMSTRQPQAFLTADDKTLAFMLPVAGKGKFKLVISSYGGEGSQADQVIVRAFVTGANLVRQQPVEPLVDRFSAKWLRGGSTGTSSPLLSAVPFPLPPFNLSENPGIEITVPPPAEACR